MRALYLDSIYIYYRSLVVHIFLFFFLLRFGYHHHLRYICSVIFPNQPIYGPRRSMSRIRVLRVDVLMYRLHGIGRYDL